MSDGLEKCAMFLIGFNILQMMNVYLVGSEFALKRFEVSSSKVSVFIASVQSVSSLASLFGLVVGVILILIGDNFLSGQAWWNKAGAILSAFLLAVVAFLQLIFFCISHGHQYVVRFYWLHVASGLCVGLIQMYGFKIFGEEASYFSFALCLTGGFVSVLHFTLKKILTSYQLDLNFWLVAIHLFFVFLIAFLGFVVFTVAVLGSPSGSSSAPKVVSAVVLAVQAVLLILTVLLFRAGHGAAAASLFFTSVAIFIVFSIAILLPAEKKDQAFAVFAAVIIPTILAILSGLLILYGFMFWAGLLFFAALVAFIVFTITVVGFPSEPSKALGAWALLLILVVLMFLTILLFQAGHVTVAVLLLLVGLGTFIFVSFALKGNQKQAAGSSGGGGGSNDSGTTPDSRSLLDLFKTGAQAAWAAIIMSVVGLAFLYVIYPVIGPILTVDSSRHHTILIWCLLLEATSGIIVYIWLEKDTNIKKRWHSESGYHYYFFLWLFFIPYFGFGMTLLWALHHPNSGFSNALRYGVWGGVMSCLYYFSAKFISNIGYGCVHGHAKEGVGSTNGETIAGYVSTLNVFLANLFLVLFTFLGNAHLSNFFMYTGKLAEGHVFPTDSMNGFRSCWFWFSCASSGAWKNFISMFSLDIKEMLLS
ncbi:hypothetical protein BdWA1_001498 [Babesia duncani]|uniref:Uncharacterized protein n=3 Tax=Babesia duncani TaxID=323732 RepID=A0AAD9UMS1_9APIC|nr:hypothetical protein BdWA1_004073 [Babesia duncani]KAK2194467.1 hypothetical protein BdWA1_004065 [Babesia duncani]KAK2194473.1 hypothetical protein BdWA1_004059 [Babesia duncani]KAK2194480.1 hypothetical protein BdWA1_004050 [Babesia duncani]KAK2194491.1 hypothetical protein BdWA1_004040 [Babesia duncani]